MITVLNPGMLTTVQDNGRWGYQAYGMPVAGAMDRFAYRVVNSLAGNSANAAVLEMTIFGGTYRFDRDAYVAIGGADMQATLDGNAVANWSGFPVSAGSELSFGYVADGCRAYLAVKGGLDVPEILGSRSTYIRGAIGGMNGRALKSGDVLNFENGNLLNIERRLPAQFIPDYGSEITLRVMLGPQDDLFTGEGIKTLLNCTYTITNDADRMGYRLEGPAIKHSGKPDIVSDALCQGAIQVPGHGMPIIMMADRQTTGGYAKIGTVIGPDIARLAQAKPGDSVRFVRSSYEEAVEALRKEAEKYVMISALLDREKENSGKLISVKVDGQTYIVNIEEVK